MRLRLGTLRPDGVVENVLRGFVLPNEGRWGRRALRYLNGIRSYHIARVQREARLVRAPPPVIAEDHDQAGDSDIDEYYWTVTEPEDSEQYGDEYDYWN